MRDRIAVAHQGRFNHLIIEGDNKIVTQALAGLIHIPWSIHYILRDILDWCEQGLIFTIKHVFHEANMAADWLSKFRHSLVGSFTTDFCFAPNLKIILGDDIIGRTLVRRGI